MISRAARIEDLLQIELQPIQEREVRQLGLRPGSVGELRVYEARTIEREGRPIACYGVTPTLPGSGEAWALLSNEALELRGHLTEDVLYWLDRTQRENKLRRVSAYAYEDHAVAHRWLVSLGFEPEGRMRSFGPGGETCWLYGRIR